VTGDRNVLYIIIIIIIIIIIHSLKVPERYVKFLRVSSSVKGNSGIEWVTT
jgi:hypothetical protein